MHLCWMGGTGEKKVEQGLLGFGSLPLILLLAWFPKVISDQ